MSEAMARANGRRSKLRAFVEHFFAQQKSRRGLFVRRTIGIAPARTKIGMANLASNGLHLARGANCPHMTAKSVKSAATGRVDPPSNARTHQPAPVLATRSGQKGGKSRCPAGKPRSAGRWRSLPPKLGGAGAHTTPAFENRQHNKGKRFPTGNQAAGRCLQTFRLCSDRTSS